MRKAIAHLKKSDPLLAAVIDRVGPCRIEYREPEFSTLVRSIVYQQLSGKVASVIFERFLNLLPRRRLTARAVLGLSVADLRSAGLSRAKAAYILDLAEKTEARLIKFHELPGLSDEDVIAMLTQVKGVGVWTAHMFLIFALQRTDILPVGDLGVRSAIRKVYGLEELPRPAEVERIAATWRPYCSVAAWYLWRSLDGAAAM
ncbi:MAG TPA: DNA-3-methyladenine glycosylase 2 family protein [Bryobacteraceae bacterium]|nr:DNA-3-methyladenine glycosylase 2 family protein [Bryobacteraceae bacterium]